MAASIFSTYECGAHDITYVAPKAGCPLCDAERRIAQLREGIQELANENRLLREEIGKLQPLVDTVTAFRTASALLDENDLVFYKTVLYQFRDQSSVSLRPMTGERVIKVDGRRKKKRIVVGVVVSPRQGDSYGHECTSIGGTMIAQTFADATNSVGAIQATKNMVRGLTDLLPGRVR